MDSAWGFLGAAGSVLALIGVIFIVIMTVARYYKKVSPNVVAVVTGRKHKYVITEGDQQVTKERGYRYIVGAGFFLVPIIEKMQEISLNVMPVPVSVQKVPDKNGALVTVVAVANIKVLSDTAMLPLAIERFLGKTEEEIKSVGEQTLEGNLRAIVGTMAIEELIRDRQTFQQNVLEEAGVDLSKMGLGVDVLKIQEIKDDRGYIESLGKKQTAEVVRNATIGEAEAHRDADIKSAQAMQAGEVAKAEATKNVSDAQRIRDMAIADNEAQVKAQQAQVPIAAEIAAANRTKELNVSKVEAEKAQVHAQIELENVRGDRNKAELNATVVVKADREREATIIAADAKQQAAVREGEATRVRMEKEGQGKQAKDTGEAEGRKAIASAVQAEKEAEAAGDKAGLLAKAAGREADLLAGAAGTRAQLLAEAEGILKKAEAYKQLDEAGRFLLILQSLPPVIDAIGVAAEKALTPVAEAIGEGLGNVKEMRIIDMGGAGGGAANGKNVVSNFVNLPVETIFNLVQKLKAAGMMPMVEGIARKYGFDLPKLLAGLPATSEAAPAAEVAAADHPEGQSAKA